MEQNESGNKKTARPKKIIIGILIACVAVLAILYAAGAFYFSSHFLPGSKINGVNCSGKTLEGVENHLADEISSYALTIKERGDNTETISADRIGLSYVDDGKVEKLLKGQNSWGWITAFTKKHEYTMSATTTVDEEKLTSAIDGLTCLAEENMQQPVDAHLEVGDNGYEIVPETEGTALDKDKVTEVITKAVKAGETEVDLEASDCYLKPSVYQDDKNLIAQRDQSNAFLKAKITIDFSDRQEVVDQSLIKDWVTTDENGNAVLDEAKVKAYVVELAKKYDTFGYPRQFKTSTGETITVSGGDYGWLMARNDTTTKLNEAIKSGKSQTIEPEYTYKGYVRDTNDIGNTYVEVSLSAQHMWFYKNGQLLVDTDVVTGNHNLGHDTKTGIYAIMYKERNATLVGEDYSSPVKYWMPFYANVGIHDASWRTTFGGSEYLNNGSHGCVNTPEANAEKIFNNIEKGVPVVVY